jgi:hypothetical protein
MQKHSITFGQTIIWVILATGLIMLNGGSVVGDNPPASRWARVDITQYCGKTVGELIDALGDDYVKYETWPTQYNTVSAFVFRYSDAVISIYPAPLKYCNADLRKGKPKIDDIRREHIDYIKLLIG